MLTSVLLPLSLLSLVPPHLHPHLNRMTYLLLKLMMRTFFLPVQYVDWQKPHKRDVFAPIADIHYGYRFKCRHCTKDFGNFNTKYRHEMEHQPPKHCPVCAKGYPFKSELDRHITVHSTVLPFGCEKCPKQFAQIKSKNRHVHVHDNKSFVCSQCDKVADTKEKLYTHFRGAHSKGYNAKCGKHFQWPATRVCHQENCDACKVIIE